MMMLKVSWYGMHRADLHGRAAGPVWVVGLGRLAVHVERPRRAAADRLRRELELCAPPRVCGLHLALRCIISLDARCRAGT